MPAPDTEPENYSIDEMMSRLRSRSEGGGEGDAELVTRADGSQMYRVKKRKRRSHQPKKEKEKRKNRLQIIQVVVGGAVAGLVGLTFVGSLVYLNSSAFRSKVTRDVEAWTGAKLDVTEFRMTPISVAAKSVTLTWPEQSALDSLKVYNIKGDIRASSLISGPLSGTEVGAAVGELVLRNPTGTVPASPHSQDSLPFQFRYKSANLNILGGNRQAPAFQVRDTNCYFTILNPQATRGNLQMNGGVFTLGDWGPYKLDFASLQMEDSGLRVGTVRFSVIGSEQSEIEINNPTGNPVSLSLGTSSTYEVLGSRVPIGSLIGKNFGTILTGDVDSPTGGSAKPGSLEFQYGEEDQISLTFPFRMSTTNSVVGSRLPMFQLLAKQCDSPAFATPAFELESRGVIRRTPSGCALEDLALDTKLGLSITGSMAADRAGNLSGSLEVGIPEAMAVQAGPAFQRAFSRRARGLVWITVSLSGTAENPKDDLADRIKAGGRSNSSDSEWEELMNPGGK